MPLVRIDYTRKNEPGFARIAAEQVRSALETALSVPREDFFQVAARREFDDGLFAPDQFLGIDHSQDLVFVQITCAEGRTAEQKKALFRQTSAGLAHETGIRSEDVIINLIETRRENWSFGLGEAPFA